MNCPVCERFQIESHNEIQLYLKHQTANIRVKRLLIRMEKRIIKDLQFFSSVPGRFAFYGVIWGFFDLMKVPLKVMPRS